MMTIDVTAIGVLAGQIQVPVQRIRQIAIDLGIQPSVRINGIPHFTSQDAERIADFVRTADKRKTVH